MDECTFRETGYSMQSQGIEGTSADTGKNQFADAVSAAFVNFDTSQVCLPSQPVDSANTTFPASHNRAALLVCPCNLPLRFAPVSECLPLLGSNASEKGRVDRIEYV